MTREELDEYIEDNTGGDYFSELVVSKCMKYITSLEQRIAKYEFEMECYRQCEEQLKACETALEELEEEELLERISESNMYCKKVMELESPRTCEGCKYNSYDWLAECKNCIRKANGDYYEPKDNS